ncbi:MAG: MFS transporter, partial [Alphaproteobacteria bacterium]
GLDTTTRGNILFAMTLAMICASLFYGYLDSLFSNRKYLILSAAGTTIAILILLAIIPDINVWIVSILLILLCFVGNYGVVIMAHGRSIFPEELLGRGIATLNTAVFLGVFVMQGMGGFIIGAFHDEAGAAPLIAYRSLFIAMAVILVVAVAIYSRSSGSRSLKRKSPPHA